jgi:hypothetical protein
MTSTVYTAPIEAVMGRLAAGKPMPSVQELADMVVEEALASAGKDLILKQAGDAIARQQAKVSAEAQANDPLTIGASLLAEGAARAKVVPGKAGTTGEGGAGGSRGAVGGGGKAVSGDAVGGRSGTTAHGADPVTTGDHDHSSVGSGGSRRDNDPALKADQRYDAGLLAQEAKLRVAQGAYEVHQKMGPTAGEGFRFEAEMQRVADRLGKVVAAEVSAAGMPMPKIVVKTAKGATYKGSYSDSEHTITINFNAEVYKSPEAFQALLGVIVHETRHAQQAFFALRVRAGRSESNEPGIVSAIMHDQTKAAKALTDAAAERPIAETDTSAEARLGREVWSEKYQEGPRKDLRDWAQSANKRRPDQLAALDKIEIKMHAATLGEPNPRNAEILAKAKQLKTELDKAYDHYFHLSGEIDARRIQTHIEGLFNAKLQLQGEINALQATVRSLRDAADRNAAYPDARQAALTELLAAEKTLVDRLQNQADLIPALVVPPPATK